MNAPGRFCGSCGGALVERALEPDLRRRAVCSQCGAIAYRNPRVVVSAIVAWGERVLLCRRAHAPAAGRWALPGGFLECGETLEEAAARETFEETGIRLTPRELRLHALTTLPELDEVYVGFHAAVADAFGVQCGAECCDVRFFEESDLPWTELSYPDVADYLRLYFRERTAGDWAVHFCRLDSVGALRHSYRIAAIEEVRTPRAAPPGGGARTLELPLTAARVVCALDRGRR